MKKIIIAPLAMHKELLKENRETNSLNNFKVISKEELLDEFFGRIEPSSYAKVMHEFGLTYEMASELANLSRFVNVANNPKQQKLLQIHSFLVNNNLLKINEYFSLIFINAKVQVIGYMPEDKQLSYIFESYKIHPEFIQNSHDRYEKKTIQFLYLEEETLNTLNKIAELIDKGISPNKIFILESSGDYDYYLEKYSKDFGYKINNLKNVSLFTSGVSVELINRFKETKNLLSSLESIEEDFKEEPIIEDLKDVVENNYYDFLSFDEQLDLLKNVLKNTNVKRDKYTNSISLIKDYIYQKDAYIFVLGFVQGALPKIYKDTGYLSDSEKGGTFIATSKEETDLERMSLLNFLRSDNNFYFSYSINQNGSKNYPTSIIKELGIHVENYKMDSAIYSQDMADYAYAKALDIYHYFLEKTEEYEGLGKITKIPYRTYSNKYSKVKAFDNQSKLRFSYSSLDEFFMCPFAYYLKRVLNLDPFDGNFFTYIGNIAHSVFEHQYDKDFDFDKAFDKAASEYQLDAAEEQILITMKEQVKEASNACLVHREYMDNPIVYPEKCVTVDIDENTVLTGKIDKIVSVKNRYYYLVDYKTGTTTFDTKFIEYGKGIQLPIYAYLSDHVDELENMELSGIYINNVIASTIKESKKNEETLIPTYLKLNGVSLMDLGACTAMDKTLESGKSSFINGIAKLKTGDLKPNSHFVTKGELNYYKEIVVKLIDKANKEIRDNKFDIEPKEYEGQMNNACSFCRFRDICFRTKDQLVSIRLNKDEGADEDGISVE